MAGIPDRSVHAVAATIISFASVCSSKAYRQSDIATRCAIPQDPGPRRNSSRCISQSMPVSVRLEMEGFHPILFGIAQQARPSKAYHRRSVVTRSGLPQDHISHHDMTPSMSLSKDSKKRNTGTERTVQTGPAVRDGCDTSSARRHSRSPTTSSRPTNSPATTGWPMET